MRKKILIGLGLVAGVLVVPALITLAVIALPVIIGGDTAWFFLVDLGLILIWLLIVTVAILIGWLLTRTIKAPPTRQMLDLAEALDFFRLHRQTWHLKEDLYDDLIESVNRLSVKNQAISDDLFNLLGFRDEINGLRISETLEDLKQRLENLGQYRGELRQKVEDLGRTVETRLPAGISVPDLHKRYKEVEKILNQIEPEELVKIREELAKWLGSVQEFAVLVPNVKELIVEKAKFDNVRAGLEQTLKTWSGELQKQAKEIEDLKKKGGKTK